jgi:hypothetical protein
MLQNTPVQMLNGGNPTTRLPSCRIVTHPRKISITFKPQCKDNRTTNVTTNYGTASPILEWYYTAQQDILHSSLDHTDRDRCLYTCSIKSTNGCDLVLESAHYHIVLISKHCDFMLVNFRYFRILIFKSFHWGRCNTWISVLGLYSFVLEHSPRMEPRSETCRSLDQWRTPVMSVVNLTVPHIVQNLVTE